jgi:hypothetical protein
MCERPAEPLPTDPNQVPDLERDAITAAQLRGVRIFQPPDRPAPSARDVVAALWQAEVTKMTEFLLDHFPGEITCGHANGESAVDTAIRLLTRHPAYLTADELARLLIQREANAQRAGALPGRLPEDAHEAP